jgi:primosomal replication protein N
MNQLVLSAQLLERGACDTPPPGCRPRFEPEARVAGQEAGTPRKVSMEIKAVVIGDLSQRVVALEIGEQRPRSPAS